MKKILALVLATTLVATCAVGCGKKDSKKESSDKADFTVAMVTDYGDITDQSFNQTTYEGCKEFCEENDVKFNYYKPSGDSTEARVASIEKAIDDGYNIIVMPGYAFGGALVEVTENYPDVKFIALDVAEGDILEAGVTAKGEEYDYNPSNWNIEDYCYMDNVYCAVYHEEISGYMAGYAAVKMGYKKLGFLGGMAVPAVIRYGYGFVQGAEEAAKEDNKTDVEIQYAYGNQFYGDADITSAVDTWYSAGTEVVFACGGGIFTSAAEAAAKVNAKVIGVDTDQAPVIDGAYGDGMTVTSAMKGLKPSVIAILDATINNDNWDEYAGKVDKLGLISGDDPEANYVQLPDSTQFNDTFTQDDYKELVSKLYDGEITVSEDTEKEPSVSVIKVNWLGNLK